MFSFLSVRELKGKKYDIVLLYSGGLDSILAGVILARQGLKVLAVKFIHPFGKGVWQPEEKFYSSPHGFDIYEVPLGLDYLEVIKNPQHGYGSNANPCIDCKIYFMKRAKEIAEQVGARGLATGEVLGQRPFSQRRSAMRLIERKAGVEGKVVRPLCAKLLPPSQLETEGTVDREKLYAIRGRGRKIQMKLAEEFGIKDYPPPAGGCLLTDPGYARRFFDAHEHGELDLEMTQLLKIGRHFRINGHKLIIGRNQHENELLEKFFSQWWILLEPKDIKGPSALLIIEADRETIELGAKIVARYCRTEEPIKVEAKFPEGKTLTIEASPLPPEEVEKLTI